MPQLFNVRWKHREPLKTSDCILNFNLLRFQMSVSEKTYSGRIPCIFESHSIGQDLRFMQVT